MAKKNYTQDIAALANVITRYTLIVLFFLVFFLSVLVSPDVDWNSLFFSLLKAMLAVGLGWIFFLIVTDAVVRSITASAIESRAERRDGGLLYHFLPPDPGELGEGENPDPPPKAKKA
jgi:hypothetical protein